jgi:hypothetical protein
MTLLLDANVSIALLDPAHIQHVWRVNGSERTVRKHGRRVH